MPEFQTKYGNQPRTYSSWGGVLATPSSYNPQDFFNTAANTQTNASISVGNEKNQTYASLMHVYANGILPNNSYDKHSVTVRNTTSFLQDRMTLDAGFSYVETEDQNMLSAGRYFNPLTSLYTYPRGESVEDLMMFEIYDSNKKRYVQNWAWSRGALDMQNPLWMMHRNIQNNKRRRSMMNASLTYKVTDWLTLAGRAKADLSVGESSRKLYASTDPLFAGGDNGFFEFTKEEDTHRYGDFIATVNKHWEQFSLFANVGASISDQLSSIAGARGPLELPNFFSLTNTNPYGASGQRLQERKREQEQAVFASVEAGWRGMLYLTATVRNEWHSNPAYTNNLSYCFPSVGLSGLIHEMVKLPSFIDYLKVRASWAEVGSPILWGISYLTYKWKQGSWSTSATRPIQNLRPKNTTSWEVGLNARLFANSLSLDFTYYKSNTKHQTFLVPLSGSAGYENMYAQTGNVENKGFELSIGYDKTWRDFAWSSSLTLSHNKNKVVELMNNYYDPQTDKYYTLKEYEVASMGGANFIMTEGGTMGDLYAYGDLWLDENGYIYINPNDPKLMVTDERIKLGSVLPDYNAGFRNDFSYKGINLSLLFSARFGGIVVSPTQGFLDGLGVSKASADARDAGGVPINNGRIDAQHYYETVGLGQLLSHYTYSATNVRLQETSIGYTFPKKWMGDRVKLTASLVGRNLWMIYCKAPFDPELTASTGSYLQGIDYFMQPSLRSLGFNVQLKF
jgi:TonB-linked SusC/RagA family outer membrane protein